jgi:hypothetical protein
MMSPAKWLWLSLLLGGTVFWIPDVVIPALAPNEQGGAITLACPTALIVFYALVLRCRRAERSGPSTAMFSLIGVWVLGQLFMMLAQTVRGSGFLAGYDWRSETGYLVVSSFVPTRIFEASALEGSEIALVLGTIAMIICHLIEERARWIIPPSLWAAVKVRHSKKN